MSRPGRSTRRDSDDHLSPRAAQVLALANREAGRFKHSTIGTEHLLLGLIKLGQGTAVVALGKMGVELEAARLQVARTIGSGTTGEAKSPRPYSPVVKKVLALAAQESRDLNHNYVGTEHLLLGLLRESDSAAARVLRALNVELESARKSILEQLEPNHESLTLSPVSPGEVESASNETVDLRKRYDVYCTDAGEEVVYRNALIKGFQAFRKDPNRSRSFPGDPGEIVAHLIEVEQSNGQTVLLAASSVTKLCAPGTTLTRERRTG